MPLTDAKCRTLKGESTPRKYSDEGGLFLLVNPNGSKLWRLAYRFDGKQKTLAFGAYPTLSLAEARDRRTLAKNALANGVDPATRPSGDEPTFREMAEQWFKANGGEWVVKHQNRVRWILESHLYPHFGELPLDEVSPKVVLAAIRVAEEKGLGELLG